jgi:hypothetical protein
MNDKDDYQRLLAKQLARNEEVWPALLALGISDTVPLQVDFHYFASSETRAQELILFLRAETDYYVELRSDFSTEGQWLIAGRTQKTTVSKEVLDHWVKGMVATGFAHDCVFDGWGVSVETD